MIRPIQEPRDLNSIADEIPAVRKEMRGHFFDGRKVPAGMPTKISVDFI